MMSQKPLANKPVSHVIVQLFSAGSERKYDKVKILDQKPHQEWRYLASLDYD